MMWRLAIETFGRPLMTEEIRERSTATFLQHLLLVLLVFVTFTPSLGSAQSFNVIYNFQWPLPVGPLSGVTMDAAGNLYGTTAYFYGGLGAVYKLTSKNGNWIFSTLFTGTGENTVARPVFGPDGSLYGTTYEGGGGCDLGCGDVYNIRPQPNPCKSILCYWQGGSIYDFDSMPNDGAWPVFGDLVFDRNGNVYGTTSSNVPGSQVAGGTVFELSRSNGVWTETTIHQFGSGDDGEYPESGLTWDSAGNLYGTTAGGGSNHSCGSQGGEGCGTVYELSPSGSGWTERVLYSFQRQEDGDAPAGGLVMDSAGNLYGTTSQDGPNGGGTIFKLTQSNGNWTLTTLYSFLKTGLPSYFCSGQQGNLLLDNAGNLYGTTCTNGAYGYGAVFKLTNSNGSWSYSSLHDFTNGNDGGNPVGNPSFDRNGNIYGTASRGGAYVYGNVWEVTP